MTSSKSGNVARAFGANLRRARRAVGLSQEDVAVRASLHRTEVGLLERGERTPRIDTAAKLAVAVGVPIQELYVGIVWTPAPDVQEGSFTAVPRPPGEEP